MYKHSGFWNVFAKRYARQPISDEAAYQRKLQATRACFTADSEVFEFGCGTGSTALAHAPFVKSILATDFSSKMIEIARDKAKTGGVVNVQFAQNSLDEVDLPDSSFDVVMGHSILHLLDDRDVAIAKVHRLLKPGGHFVSNTACIGGSMPLVRKLLPVGRALRILPLVRFFTEGELLQSLTDAGFEIETKWTLWNDKVVFVVARKAG